MRDEPALRPVAFDDNFLVPPDIPGAGDAPLRDEYERLLRAEDCTIIFED